MKISLSDRAWFDKVLRSITAADAGPSDQDIALAPLLSDWKPAISPCGHVILWGEVTGHPILGNASITTSQLIAINSEAGWARTASRWYRLGRGFDEVGPELAHSLNGKRRLAGSMAFTVPGYTNVDDPELLAQLLAKYIEWVYEIDAADQAAPAVGA